MYIRKVCFELAKNIVLKCRGHYDKISSSRYGLPKPKAKKFEDIYCLYLVEINQENDHMG